MGVRGLETFLQRQVEYGVFSINILEEIDRKKREDAEEPVVLVFNVIDISYNIIANLNKTEIICGPAHRKIHDIFDKSFQQLKNYGVQLHFFIQGPTVDIDFKTWTRKQNERYSSNIAVINQIDSNIPIKEIKEMEKRPGSTTPLNDLRITCQKYGTLHVSLSRNLFVDIVKYANDTNALAIVANSSNFLIFNGGWRYWSCRHIGLMEGNWDTIEYNKSALLNHIELSQSQMPMLATIAGNDFVPHELLISLHNRIYNRKIDYFTQHFPSLAKYIQKFSGCESYEEKREFSSDLFGCSDFHHYKMVCDSFNFYKTKTDDTQGMDSLLVAAASIDRTYYYSLTETPIRMNLPSFYDLRRTDFLSFFDIELPILKRQIGFVRRHKNDTNYTHNIEVKLSHSERHRTMCVIPEYPIFEIPNLMELTFNEGNDHFNKIRFKLLKWMAFGDDFHPQFLIQQIPKGYCCAVVTLMYLVKLKQLSTSEVDAILLSIHLINENKDYATDIQVPANITSRALIVSHLYICLHNNIVKCFRFLGLNNFIDYLCFDGVYFIHWLNELSTNDHEEILTQIEYLKYFLLFVND